MLKNLLVDLHVASVAGAVGWRDRDHHEKCLHQIELRDSFLEAFFERLETFSAEMTLDAREELLDGSLAHEGDTLRFQ